MFQGVAYEYPFLSFAYVYEYPQVSTHWGGIQTGRVHRFAITFLSGTKVSLKRKVKCFRTHKSCQLFRRPYIGCRFWYIRLNYLVTVGDDAQCDQFSLSANCLHCGFCKIWLQIFTICCNFLKYHKLEDNKSKFFNSTQNVTWNKHFFIE